MPEAKQPGLTYLIHKPFKNWLLLSESQLPCLLTAACLVVTKGQANGVTLSHELFPTLASVEALTEEVAIDLASLP